MSDEELVEFHRWQIAHNLSATKDDDIVHCNCTAGLLEGGKRSLFWNEPELVGGLPIDQSPSSVKDGK